MAKTVVQITLDEIKNPFKSLEDIKVEIEIVIDNLVMGIETPLDMMSIAL